MDDIKEEPMCTYTEQSLHCTYSAENQLDAFTHIESLLKDIKQKNLIIQPN